MPFLGPSESSGTPLETRDASGLAGSTFADLFSSGMTQPTGIWANKRKPVPAPASFEDIMMRLSDIRGRMGAGAATDILGFDSSGLNLGAVAGDLLASPADQTKGLFESLEPFEARDSARRVAQLREDFGMGGGRFGRNKDTAERELLGEISSRNLLTRQQGLLEGRDRQQTAFDSILRSILGSRQIESTGELAMLSEILNFIRPGESVRDEGLLPGLLSAGSTLGAAAML